MTDADEANAKFLLFKWMLEKAESIAEAYPDRIPEEVREHVVEAVVGLEALAHAEYAAKRLAEEEEYARRRDALRAQAKTNRGRIGSPVTREFSRRNEAK